MTISRTETEIHIRCSGYGEALRIYAGIVFRELELEALTSKFSRPALSTTLALLDEMLKATSENRIIQQSGKEFCAGDSIRKPRRVLG